MPFQSVPFPIQGGLLCSCSGHHPSPTQGILSLSPRFIFNHIKPSFSTGSLPSACKHSPCSSWFFQGSLAAIPHLRFLCLKSRTVWTCCLDSTLLYICQVPPLLFGCSSPVFHFAHSGLSFHPSLSGPSLCTTHRLVWAAFRLLPIYQPISGRFRFWCPWFSRYPFCGWSQLDPEL